jgi:hypothetical protein
VEVFLKADIKYVLDRSNQFRHGFAFFYKGFFKFWPTRGHLPHPRKI